MTLLKTGISVDEAVWFFSSITAQVTIPGLSVPGVNGCIGLPTSISLVAVFPFTFSCSWVTLILFTSTSFDIILLETDSGSVVVEVRGLIEVVMLTGAVLVTETAEFSVDDSGCVVVESVILINSGVEVEIFVLGDVEDASAVVGQEVVGSVDVDALAGLVLYICVFWVVVLGLVVLVGLVDETVGFLVFFIVNAVFFVVLGGLRVVVVRIGLIVDLIGFWVGFVEGGFVARVGFADEPRKRYWS